MLGVVAAVIVGFAFLIWNAYRTGARRYEALQKSLEAERNQTAAE